MIHRRNLPRGGLVPPKPWPAPGWSRPGSPGGAGRGTESTDAGEAAWAGGSRCRKGPAQVRSGGAELTPDVEVGLAAVVC